MKSEICKGCSKEIGPLEDHVAGFDINGEFGPFHTACYEKLRKERGW